jgi:hypothetical protein
VISACFITRCAVLLAVARGAPAVLRHQHVVEPELTRATSSVGDAGVADGARMRPRLGSEAKKAVFTSGEWAMA